MDIFYEQFLSKDYSKIQKSVDSIQKALLVLAIINVIFLGLIWSLITLAVYFVVFIISRTVFLEFEYELTYSELVISKIINKRSRKIVGKINIEGISEVVSPNNFNRSGVKIINASLKDMNKEGLNEKILIVQQNSNLIGYKIAMDDKLYKMCRRINPIVFNR